MTETLKIFSVTILRAIVADQLGQKPNELSDSEVCRTLGLPRGTFSNWAMTPDEPIPPKSQPRVRQAVAAYLGQGSGKQQMAVADGSSKREGRGMTEADLLVQSVRNGPAEDIARRVIRYYDKLGNEVERLDFDTRISGCIATFERERRPPSVGGRKPGGGKKLGSQS